MLLPAFSARAATAVGVDTTTGANWRTAANLTYQSDGQYGTAGYLIYGIMDTTKSTYIATYADNYNESSLPSYISGITRPSGQGMWPGGTGNFGFMQDPQNSNASTVVPLLNSGDPGTFTITRSTSAAFRLTILVACGDNAAAYTTTVNDGISTATESATIAKNGGLNYHVYDVAAGTGPVTVTSSCNQHYSVTGFAFDTVPASPPTKLVFSSFPATPALGVPFSVTVQAQDAGNLPQNVTGDTVVQLSVTSGSGTLSGTTSGTITNGNSSITFSGLTYSASDAMTLQAAVSSGMGLTAATTNLTYSAGASKLAFSAVPATPVTGWSFAVTVQAQDTGNVPQPVASDTVVQLSVTSGSGTLTGTTSGTITSGSSSVTISGVFYSVADTMTLQAAEISGQSLTAATTSLTFTAPSVQPPPATATLALWVDASQLPLGPVTTVPNLVPGGGSFSASGTAPTVEAGINYVKALKFAGNGALLSGNAYTYTGSNQMTVFCVATSASAAANSGWQGYLSFGTGSGADYNTNGAMMPLGAYSGGVNFAPAANGGFLAGNGVPMPQATPYITAQKVTLGVSSTFAVKTANSTNNATGGGTNAANFNVHYTAIGGRINGTSAGSYWSGDVGEVLVYNSILSDSDITAVEAYLTAKWLTAPPATQLAFSSVPTNAAVGVPFNVTVQARDTNGVPSPVTSDTVVQLSVTSGSGTLSGGTTSGTITSGTSSVTISGVIYTGVGAMTLEAAATSGQVLTATTTDLTFASGASKLAFSSVPATPDTAWPFAVTVQALDADNVPRPVASDTVVQLSTTSGSGTLTGTTSGTITTGSSSVTISGVVYSVADTMTLEATETSGQALTAATTSLTFTAPSVQAPPAAATLALWVDASKLPLGTVTTVPNLVPGSASFSTTGTAPTVEAGINGVYALKFTGNGALLSGNAYTYTGSNKMTVFCVATSASAAANSSWQGYLSFGTGTGADYNTNGAMMPLGAYSGGVNFAPAASGANGGFMAGNGVPMPQATPYITAQTITLGSASTFALWTASSPDVTASGGAGDATAFNVQYTAIGGRMNNTSVGNYWSGDVGEILVYDSILSAGDIAAVKTYLENKWFYAVPPSAYGTWASAHGLTGSAGSGTDPAFDADPNHDGVANGLVWLIGGPTGDPLANSSSILPAAADDGGKLVLTFKCLKSASRGTANLYVEYSKDLGVGDAWHVVAVPDSDQPDSGSGVGFVVTPITDSDYNNVTATIASPDTGGKIFGRLTATEN